MPKFLPVGAVIGAAAIAAAVAGCGSAAPVSAAAGHAQGAVPAARLAANVRSAASRATLHPAVVRVGSRRATIVVTAADKPVYLLTGDRVGHPQCTSRACLGVWPAVTATHPSTSEVSAKLSIWRHDGLRQLTLNGHPLYTYAGDSRSGSAAGEGLVSFGGTWLVLSPRGSQLSAAQAHRSASATTTGTGSSAAGW